MKIAVFLAVLAISGSAQAQTIATCAAYVTHTDKTIVPYAKRQIVSILKNQGELTGREINLSAQCVAEFVAEERQDIARQCLSGFSSEDSLVQLELRLQELRSHLLLAVDRCVTFTLGETGPVIPLKAPE